MILNLPKRQASANAMAFWEDTLRYLYLPRLKNRDVFAHAIRSGAKSRDFFGTAYGQSGDTYEGFRWGDGNIQFDDTLLLIEPEAAKQYEASIKKPDNRDVDTVPPVLPPADQTKPVVPPVIGAKPKTFHGSIQINPSTAKMRLVQVAEEIISVLANDPQATVRVSVEIGAEFPGGVSDQIKRAVSENAGSLGFKNKTWE